MKNKFLLATLALPLAFGACTNDDFETVSQPQGANGELVEVGPGFAISASKGGNEAATRGQWIEAQNGTSKFLNYAWWPNYVYNDKKTPAGYDAVRDEIGLCWVGQSVGTNVYTNYRFQHAGWLNEDETTAEISPCEPYDIENGYELKNDLEWKRNNRYELNDGDMLNSNALDLLTGKYKAEGNQYLAEIGGTNRNLNSAFFRTPSETLFKGDYIAYLPFTPEMTEAGAVLAHSPEEVTVLLDETAADESDKNIRYAHLGSDMFMYAYAPNLVGGTQASNFSFKHLSGLIRIKAKADFSRWSKAGDEGLSGITSITLVDAAGKFVTEVGLDASKIVAEGNGASTGAALYVPGTAKYTNMLTAHIDNDNSNVVQDQTSEISIYIPALPTTTGQLSVVLYNHDLKLSAVYELDASSIEVKPGQVTTIEMGMIDIEDFTQKVVTTEKALYQLVGTNGTAKAGDIIRLMGDIKLGTLSSNDANTGDGNASSLSTGWRLNNAVTLNGGKVVVPANFTWTIGADATVNSDIEIENKGCCEKNNGVLKIGTNAKSQKTTLNGTIDNYGDILFEQTGADINTKNVTTITGKLNNHETLVPETGKTNYATITINPLTQVDLKGATVVNDAEFTINAVGNNASNQDGLLNLDSNASITNNYYLTNAGNINNNGGKLVNEKDGWIIDRISATFGVTQPVNNGGQYVCEVNGQTRLNDALAKSLTTRVRFISNDAQNNAVTGDMAKALYTNVDASNYGGYGNTVGYNKAAYDISGLQAPNIDFEIAAKTTNGYATDVIRLYSKDGSASEGAGSDVKIGKLILTSGWLDVPNFTKFNGKVYEDATFEMESIEVNGEEVQESKLQGKIITVNGDIKVLKMKGESDDILTIGGIVQSGTNGSYELTKLKVGGNFVVGSTEKEDKAAVAFNNNNTTDVKGSFSLYKNGTCDIKVATATGIDNQVAKVWASSLPIDEGKWANSSKVSIGEHPLW